MRSPVLAMTFSLLCVGAGIAAFASAQTFENRRYIFETGAAMEYRLYLPPGYDDPTKEFPVVVWLHGSGSSGVSVPSGLVSAAATERFAAFVVSPTVFSGDNWTTCTAPGQCLAIATNSLDSVIGVLDELDAEFAIDPSRRTVAGISAGGIGAAEALIYHSGVFSTAVPISGARIPLPDSLLSPTTRIWAIHGHDDEVVPAWVTSTAIERMYELGAEVIYQEPSGGHMLTRPIFDDPELGFYPWLFEGVTPPIAEVIYNSVTGAVSIDATKATDGHISSFSLSSKSALAPPSVSEIDGDAVRHARSSIAYRAANGIGFSGVVNLGEIVPPGMGFAEFYDNLRAPLQYNDGVFQLIVVPEPSSALTAMIALAAAFSLPSFRRLSRLP